MSEPDARQFGFVNNAYDTSLTVSWSSEGAYIQLANNFGDAHKSANGQLTTSEMNSLVNWWQDISGQVPSGAHDKWQVCADTKITFKENTWIEVPFAPPTKDGGDYGDWALVVAPTGTEDHSREYWTWNTLAYGPISSIAGGRIGQTINRDQDPYLQVGTDAHDLLTVRTSDGRMLLGSIHLGDERRVYLMGRGLFYWTS